MNGDLLDVNVWIALSLSDHPFHARAETYWRTEAASRLLFCRVTALGMVRVCSVKATLGGFPLSTADAWAVYRRWREHPGVDLTPEPPQTEKLLGTWAEAGEITPRMWTDAYLAAVAIAGDFRLVTFDSDFRRFPGLNKLELV